MKLINDFTYHPHSVCVRVYERSVCKPSLDLFPQEFADVAQCNFTMCCSNPQTKNISCLKKQEEQECDIKQHGALCKIINKKTNH